MGEKKSIAAVLAIILISGLVSYSRSCSDQGIAYNWECETEIVIEPNQKLLMIAWMDSNLWYLTREMTEHDIAENYKFQEKDSIGLPEGTVYIHEQKMTEEEYKQWVEEYKVLPYDYYREGNLVYDNDLYSSTEVYIHYDDKTNTYKKIRNYTIDEEGCLVPAP